MERKNSNNMQQSGNSVDNKYTCGFIFHHTNNDNILLIRKERPKWQSGYLNGIGGKIETFDKTPLDG